MRRVILLLPVLLLALGCEDSPTEPDRVFTLTGTVEKDKPVVEVVEMSRTGNVRLELVSADRTSADGTVVEDAGLVVQVGSGNATLCLATGVFSFANRDVVSIGLTRGSYCLRMSETVVLAEGAKLTYNLGVEITE